MRALLSGRGTGRGVDDGVTEDWVGGRGAARVASSGKKASEARQARWSEESREHGLAEGAEARRNGLAPAHETHRRALAVVSV